MPRRALLAVAACLLLGACGAPHSTETLDHEPDLAHIAGTVVPSGLRSPIVDEVHRLRHACAQIDVTVERAEPGAQLKIDDARCQWSAPSGVPLLVVGIVDGGAYRFHETAKLLKDEHTVDGIGDDALYDQQMRAVFSVRANRLWYVQLVGPATTGADARTAATTIATALMRSPVTA
jgi:hypothetical protein